MKKLLLMFFALFAMTFFAKAQVPVLSEDFEGSAIPSGWTTIDADNDGSNWEHSTVQEELGGYNSNGAVVSHSYDNNTYEALFPDNWLISPTINLSGTSSLSFWFVVAQAYPADHFGVYISTTSATDTSAFTSIFEYTPTSANGTWTQQTIDLTSYAGNAVYIAFRHYNCTDQFLLALDDIVVYSGTTETMLTVNPSTVNFGMVSPNDHSTVAPVVVTGYNTTAAISATVSAPFEISDNNTTNFGYSVTLPAAGDTLYVRYSPTNEGADNGTVSLTSGTASASVTLTGTAVDCNIALPYTETFAATSGTRDCWTLVSNNETNVGGTNGMGYLTVNGREVLQFSSYGSASDYNQYAFSPRLNVSSSATNLNVSVVYGTRASDYLYFGYITDTDTIWNSTPYNTNSTYSTYNWETETFVIPATATQLAVHYYGNYQFYAWIDSVEITEMTTEYCFPANNLTASNVTAHEATLTWADVEANSYTIYDLSDTTIVEVVNDNTYNLTNLTSDTQFNYGVVSNCTSGNSDMVTVTFHTQISCPVPTGLAVVLTPGDGTVATLNWNENGTATAWQICLNGDENNLIDVTDTTYDFTSLTPEQAYTVKVRANCDADDQSSWSNLITFTPTNAYYVTVNEGTNTNSYVPIYGLYVDDLTHSQFIIPTADLTTMQYGTINKLTFYASTANVNWGAATFNVYVTETNETTLSELVDYSTMTQVYTGSLSIVNNTMEVNFTTPYLYMGGNLMIGFDQTLEGDYASCYWYGVSATGASMGGHGSYVNQRNFLPKTTISYTPGDAPNCLPVSNITVSNITTDGATLTWTGTADNFSIIDLSDSSIVATVNDVTYDITGLDPQTNYTFGIVANCGSDQSMMMSVSFTTPCDATDIPFIEDFNLNSPTLDCWTVQSMNSTNSVSLAYLSTSPDTAIALRFSSYNNASDYNQYAWSPVFNYDGSESNLSLTIRYSTYGSGDELWFGYITPTDTVWSSESYTTSGQSDLQYYIANIPSTATQVAIHYYGNFAYYAWIDEIMVTEGAACLPVTNLTIDNTTDNSVTISWSGDADSYDVYNGTTYEATVTVDTTYTFTNLAASSNYTFGVIANCSATSQSTMVSVSASTECGIIDVFPYTQDFSAAPACWTMIDADGDGYNWSLYQGAIQSASFASSALTPDNWLISPHFAIPATGNYEVTWSATAQDQSWPAEHYGIFISTTGNDNTSDFTMIEEWTLTTGIFNPVIDLSSYAGQNIYIALRHFNCTDQFRISIDDFSVREQAGANQVVINVGQNNPAYGSVTGSGIYNIGDSVTVSATANSGYTFSKWIDENNAILSTDNPYTFIATTDLTLNAIFLDAAGTTYTITVEVNDSIMGTATGGGTYTAGDQITLTATANSGYHFVNWTQESEFGINVVGTETSLGITVTGDKTFIANFEADSGNVTQYTVTLNTADATMGTVSPAGATTVNEGSSFTASATANTGYHFVAWMNGTTQVSTANPYTFTVSENITLTATFEANPATQYIVTLNTADATMGTVSPAGANTVNEGSSFTATATALDGYHFVNWTDDNGNTFTTNPYTFTVNGNLTLTASFEANDPQVTYYNVTVNSADANMGNVSSTHSGQVAENTVVTVTATPANGYRFVAWMNGNTQVSTDNPYTFTVTEDITLTATFELVDGINDIDASNVLIYANNSTIYVRGAEGHDVFVYDMNGRCIYQHANANETETISMSSAGIYMVRIDNAIFKKVVIVK